MQQIQKSIECLYDVKVKDIGVSRLRMYGEEALSLMIQEIKTSKNYQVREALVPLIASIKKLEAIDALIELTEDPDRLIGNIAHQNMKRIARLPLSSIEWKTWWAKNRDTFKFN